MKPSAVKSKDTRSILNVRISSISTVGVLKSAADSGKKIRNIIGIQFADCGIGTSSSVKLFHPALCHSARKIRIMGLITRRSPNAFDTRNASSHLQATRETSACELL